MATQVDDTDFAATAAEMQQAQAQQASAPAPGGSDLASPADSVAPQAPSEGVAPVVSPPGVAAPSGGLGIDWKDPNRLGGLSKIPDAIGQGAARAVAETKDFLFGKTPETEQSLLRSGIEAEAKANAKDNIGIGLTQGLSQFGVGMIGAGKIQQAVSLIPKVAAVGEALIAGSGVVGKAVQFSGKAAAVGAVAFDPHQERLSNGFNSLVQGTFLENPVTRFLASDPADSNATGRFKAALESIGVDGIAVALFKGIALGVRARKAYSEGKGSIEEVHAADAEVQQAVTEHEGSQLQPQEAVDSGIVRSANDNDGFDVVAYHGTSQDFHTFDPEAKGSGTGGSDTKFGFFFAKDPATANNYAGYIDPEASHGGSVEEAAKQVDELHGTPNVRPTKIKMDNPYVHDFEGAAYSGSVYSKILQKAKDAGHDGAVLKNVHDGGPATDVYVVFDPANIKSKFEDGTTSAAKTEPLKVGGDQPTGATGANDNAAGGKYARALSQLEADPAHATGIDPAVISEFNAGPKGDLKAWLQERAGLQVEQVPSGTAPLGGTKPPALQAVTDAQMAAIVKSSHADIDAMNTFGGWAEATDNGHVFNKDSSVPWQKIGEPYNEGGATALDAFVDRMAEHLKPQMDKLKGGDVMSDARVSKLVDQLGTLWGVDPAALTGMIATAGKDAISMVAKMEAGFRIGQRAMQDTFAMASKIHGGFLDEWGGDKDAAHAALKEMMAVSAHLFGSAMSMRAAAGRTMRRMRGEFKLDPQQALDLQALNGDQLAALLAGTGGNPRGLAKAMNPGWWAQTVDGAQWLMRNGLISGPLTHFYNLASNTAVALARPMERVAGSYLSFLHPSVSGEAAQRIRAESLRSYYYMGASSYESLQSAMKSWSAGDSILAPHSSELQASATTVGAKVQQADFKPMTSVGNMLYNVLLLAPTKLVGAPERLSGFADEFYRQTTYRAVVMSNAHVEGLGQGLSGDPLKQFIRTKLFDSFDDAGRAVDLKALQEAKVATFGNDLSPGTLGAGIQQAANQAKEIKVILPFIKTPSNVLRMGWQLTPILNLAQKEYRAALSGAMGPEAATQAMGQMAMGGLIMTSAAWMANHGMVTGGGPSDPKAKDALQATGWRPYSVVSIKPDGSKTFTPYSRMDPIAMPIGIAADIIDVLNTDPEDGDTKAQQMAAGLLIGITKNISNKTYLRNLAQAIEGLTDPDKSMAKTAGGIATGFIPFSAAMRFGNQDPHMRDARDFTDRIKMSVPGFSETLPAKRDAWGDPITVNKGLWVTGKTGIVDAETSRIATDYGLGFGRPNPGVEGGVDLRDIKLKNGQNAYERYEELSRQPVEGMKPLKDLVADLMHKAVYQNAQEGGAGTKGTKMYMVAGVMARYRNAAAKVIKSDPNVRAAMIKKQMDVIGAARAQRDTGTNQGGTQLLDSLGISPQ
jgi:hypothetical protein